MSEQLGGRFEKLQHFVFGGDVRIVPLLIKFNGEPVDEETAALLQVTNILGGSFEDDFRSKLSAFRDDYKKVLRGENPAMMITDDQGAGAVSVSSEFVAVSSVDKRWNINPELFGDFLDAWVEFNGLESD